MVIYKSLLHVVLPLKSKQQHYLSDLFFWYAI